MNNQIINGNIKSGIPVRQELSNAVQALANTVKTSLGPIGMDKMLVNDIGDIVITNDGRTIIGSLDVQHPAARVIADLAKLQDEEVGDGTTSVVILAAELVKRAQNMVQNQKIHPTQVISGYRIAGREAVKHIRSHLSVQTSTLGREGLLSIARTSLCSKIVSVDLNHFAEMVIQAVESVATEEGKYPVKAISILKQHGKQLSESFLVDGFALNCTRAGQGMPTVVNKCKIALLDFDLKVSKMRLGVQILVDDPKEVELIRRKEADMARDRITKIIDAGANVILTTRGIDDATMKYMVEAKVMGVRRCKKDDLKRLAKACGGQVLLSLATADDEDKETFDPVWLGTAEKVSEERFADDECLLFKGCAKQKQSSFILRGANSYLIDEAERSLNDALQAVKRTLETPSVVPGGGAVETALSVHLEKLAYSVGSREQIAILEFANALLTIPKQLAMNATLDAIDLLAQLRVAHSNALEDGSLHDLRFTGLNLFEGRVQNSLANGVMEPAISKIKSLQSATEAAISIIRIEVVITLNKLPDDDRDECQ